MPAAPPPITPIDYRPRRWAFALLVTFTVVGMTALMVAALAGNGFDVWDRALTLCFVLTLPWTVIGFWNAVIGLILMRRRPAASRGLDGGDPAAPITLHTGILSCIRNESVTTVARNLDRMIAGLAASGHGERFQVWVLSDSDRPHCLAAEAAAVERLQRDWAGRLTIGYRRRDRNPGYKAGNIQSFLADQGRELDLALILDADSLMAADSILRPVRIMQANPRLGILQSLVVGLPTASAFARAFQFGMRLGMRSYTLGSAWWQGDCGPYWGHNALLRAAPFREHCGLPRLPGRPPLGGWVLSHDQVEAVLMRRAGYAVQVLPTEGGSWEENPPTLLQFIRRDLRWCQGNMQYLRLLRLPGLRPVSRVQLVLAILMFLASPAWVALMAIMAVRPGLAADPGALVDPALGLMLFTLLMVMVFAPKLTALTDLLLTPDARRAFGGVGRVLAGTVAEILFFTLLAPVMAIAHTLFIGGLLAGRTLGWDPQQRGGHPVGWAEALGRLWPQTLVGLAALVWLGTTAGAAAFWLSPFFLGALLAVPLAVVSASPRLGITLTRLGLWRIPEETAPDPLLRSLDLSALAAIRNGPDPRIAAPAAEAVE